MTEISMRSFIDGRSVEQSHRFVLRAIFWQIFLLSRSSTFPEFLLTLTVLASHRRELRPFQTRLPKVCFWIFQVDIEDTDGFIIVSDMSTIQSFSYIFLATGRASFGSKKIIFLTHRLLSFPFHLHFCQSSLPLHMLHTCNGVIHFRLSLSLRFPQGRTSKPLFRSDLRSIRRVRFGGEYAVKPFYFR